MNNLDKTQSISPQKWANLSANKADTLSKMTSNSPAPAATSSKPRSVSRSSRKDESFSQRVPMEEEPNPSSEPRYQSLRAQEQKMEQEGSQNTGHTDVNLPIYMQIEMTKGPDNNENQDFAGEKEEVKFDNNGEELNNGLGAKQGRVDSTNPTRKVDLLACLEKMTMEDIKKNFFELQRCLPCRIKISKKYRDHIKNHIKGKKSIKCNYSFDLHANGQSLQVKCKKCQQTFTDLTAQKLEEHNQACNSGKIIPNNRPLDSIIVNGSEEWREDIKALKDQMTSFGTRLAKTEVKLAGVYKTQGTMKKKLNNNEKRVTGVEKNVKTLDNKVEDHEGGMVMLVNHLISLGHYEKLKEPVTSTDIFRSGRLILKPKKQSKEEERDSDRSRDRDRSGSSERKTGRQRSRDQRHHRDRERTGEKRHGRREDSKEDNRRTTRNGNKGRQSYRSKDSSRRY